MKHKLTIAERLGLLNILPTEGNIATLKIVRDLQSELSFSEEETKRYGVKVNLTQGMEGNVTWASEFSKATKEIEFGDTAKDLIAERLKILEDRKGLRMEMLTLFEKFVGKP